MNEREGKEHSTGSLKGRNINEIHKGRKSYFKNIIEKLKINNLFISNNTIICTSEQTIIPVRINASYINNNDERKRLILLTATDITFQMKTENLIIRAIIDTQEKERQRLAKDLHDSFGQQLSAIKFYISTATNQIKNHKH